MALLKDYLQKQEHFDGALIISNAYWRVENVSVSKSNAVCIVSVNRKDGDKVVSVANQTYNFVPVLDSQDNFIAQAYKHLKTLPEFAGAIDC